MGSQQLDGAPKGDMRYAAYRLGSTGGSPVSSTTVCQTHRRRRSCSTVTHVQIQDSRFYRQPHQKRCPCSPPLPSTIHYPLSGLGKPASNSKKASVVFKPFTFANTISYASRGVGQQLQDAWEFCLGSAVGSVSEDGAECRVNPCAAANEAVLYQILVASPDSGRSWRGRSSPFRGEPSA